MPSTAELYAQEIRREQERHATWLPSSLVRLGEVGVFEKSIFNPQTTLQSLGVTPPSVSGMALADIAYQSQGGVNLVLKASGQTSEIVDAVATTDAGVAVQFTGNHGVLFHATGLREERFDDELRLQGELKGLIERDLWDPAWAVVTSVVHADTATIIVSNERNAGLQMRVGAELGGSLANLAQLDLGLSIASINRATTYYIAERELTPLFRARVLKARFARDPKWESAFEPDELELESESADEEQIFVEYEYPAT